ncbi:MAG: hypothetical protein BD935_00085 [Marine Group III euryarchaeote CG-Epi1]|uniref:DUF354 domain-containing protein n=1 Tax=Marine Group III euryarchaeote CG-Epi1 TaxID=1888995 RepID=A0A1J5TY39_9ARCH|nr:MAG: hypothetical protein BD935_00085 [Marine Group III euryarchaeote CG-Epi1]
MRVLVSINHPKQVFIFKNLIRTLILDGHEVKILSVSKDISNELLDNLNIDYKIMGSNQSTFIKKIINLFVLFFSTLFFVKVFKPDIFLGQAVVYFGFVSKIVDKPYIIVEDTECVDLIHAVTIPLCTKVVTPDWFLKNFGKKHVRFSSFLENFYLHPKYFSPNPQILKDLKINKNDKCMFIRFVSWNAIHDDAGSSMTFSEKLEFVDFFSSHFRIFISSESKLPPSLSKYEVNLSGTEIHDLLHYCSIYVGESPTMTTESALLGTPSICINSWANPSTLGNFSELSRKDLIKCTDNIDEARNWILERFKGTGSLSTNNLENYSSYREVDLNDKLYELINASIYKSN